jgi:hypothetical protein
MIDACWLETRDLLDQQATVLNRGLGEQTYEEIIYNYFLATVHVIVVTPDQTFAFGSGDGVVWHNETTQSLDPPSPNAPAYPAYAVCSTDTDLKSEASFDLHWMCPTRDLEFAGVATDGLDDLLASSDQEIRTGPVGGLQQFQDECYLQNESLVTRRLREIGDRHHILPDDTTLAYLLRHD